MQSAKGLLSSPKLILESLAKITEQSETQTLISSLVATVVEMTSAEFVAVLRVSSANRTEAFAVEAYAEKTPGLATEKFTEYYHAVIQASIAGRVNQSKWHDGKYVVTSPILNQTGSAAEYITLAVFGSPNHDHETLILGFTKILQNFVRILHDGERDSLTSLLNRKRFQDRLYAIIGRQRTVEQSENPTKRRGPNLEESYWLGLLDIDHFKRINDEFGHLFGDEVILMVARCLQANFRDDDLLFRYGGEEFVVVIGPCDKTMALKIFERFRLAVAATQMGRAKQVTVSIGLVKVSLNDIPITIVGNADKALYFAKEHGRNQIAVYEDLLASGDLTPPDVGEDFDLF